MRIDTIVGRRNVSGIVTDVLLAAKIVRTCAIMTGAVEVHMSVTGKRAIEERVRIIAEWRLEREMQDMLGLGPEAAQRSRRSANGLVELADAIAILPDDDPRITDLERLAFSGDVFVPGATLLEELGRFRFHEPEQEIDAFIDHMVTFATRDVEEMGLWGGPQLPGDNPWSANWIVTIEDDEDDW